MGPSALQITRALCAGVAAFVPVYFGATWWANVLGNNASQLAEAVVWLNLAAYGAWFIAGFVAATVCRRWHFRIGAGVGIACTLLVFAIYLLSGGPSLVASVRQDWYLWLGNGLLLGLAGAFSWFGMHWLVRRT